MGMRKVLMLMVVMLPLAAEAQSVAPLATPTGAHSVGTTVTYLTDTSRRDADFPGGRPITLQLWYPAARNAKPVAPYLFEHELRDVVVSEEYYGMDTVLLRAWSTVRTHSRVGAPISPGRHPLLTYSVGLGVVRAN
jgi:hypothetical protein